MVKKLLDTNFEKFYKVNEYVAQTSPMRTHYHSSNPAERWLWNQKKKHIENIFKKLLIKNVVDLGCGDVEMLDVIPKKIDYTGIDISPTQIAYARKKIKKIGRKNTKVKIGDVLNSDFKSNTFDAALLCDIVEHVLDPERLFNETKKLVKKNGHIIISIPNEFMWKTIRAMLCRYPLRSPDHIHSIKPIDIKSFFKTESQISLPLPFSSQFSLINIFYIKNVK